MTPLASGRPALGMAPHRQASSMHSNNGTRTAPATAGFIVPGSAARPPTTTGRTSGPTSHGIRDVTSPSSWNNFMRSLLNKLLGWIAGRRPKLRCNRAAWRIGTAELARRTRGRTQESGAYLLGESLSDGSHLIREFVFYEIGRAHV